MSEQPTDPDEPRPALLAHFDELLPEPGAGGAAEERETGSEAGRGRRGALWRLAEPGRQLDANLLRLPPDAQVPAHAEPDLDVLLVGFAGSGELRDADGSVLALRAGAAVWLPHGSRRSLAAGPDGLAYLTVHRRRPGMAIASEPPPYFAAAREPEGGEPACALNRVCPECGHLEDGPRPERCPRCGAVATGPDSDA